MSMRDLSVITFSQPCWFPVAFHPSHRGAIHPFDNGIRWKFAAIGGHMDHAVWEWGKELDIFRGCEYLEISHLPESGDFVMPLMVFMLRVDLFVTTIVVDPVAGKKAVIPSD
jgi:hypothetical protein